MLLLHMSLWFGPGRYMPEEDRRHIEVDISSVGYVTNHTLRAALHRLHRYQEAYNAKYAASIEYTLLSVSTIDFLGVDEMEMMNITLIEDLPITKEDIE